MRTRWIVVACVSTLCLAGCDWPTFMANAAHTGASPDTSLTAADVAAGLPQRWQAALPDEQPGDGAAAPVVAGGLVYVAAKGGVVAYKADGGTNCDTGTPKSCQPAWRSANLLIGFESTPSIANGVLYVSAATGANQGAVLAFDAAGVQNCISGTNDICSPLWASSTIGAIDTAPVVAYNHVYVASEDGSVYAFDSAGQAGCNASHICSPLFTQHAGSALNSSPAVINDVLYVGSDSGKLVAFDAHGVKKCSGQVCQPLWTAATGGAVSTSPAVADGHVFIGSSDQNFYSFDAAGETGCTGTTTITCKPLWKATTPNVIVTSPAVANGVVYIGTLAGGSIGARLLAFDDAGTVNCSGSPRTCQPLWSSGPLGLITTGPVSIANGVVYVNALEGISFPTGDVFAFDATAPATRCSGTPKVCTPLTEMTTPDEAGSGATIANGFVYYTGTQLHAYGK